MLTRVRRAELYGGAGTDRTVLFEGRDHGSQVSIFLVNSEPGQGPLLHRHPYSETWIVQAGHALFVVDGQEARPEVGEILVAGAGTAHKFLNLGPDRLQLVCIHASPELIQEDLESEEDRVAFARAAMATRMDASSVEDTPAP